MDQQQHQHQKQNQNQQIVGMGRFSLELASQALAATGSKSTLKATEWILKRRASDGSNTINNNNAIVGKGGAGSQSRLDLFFQSGNANTSTALQLRSAPEEDPGCSAGGGLDESESHTSDTREDDAFDNAQSGGSGEGAVPGVRGFDSVGGAALGWRSVNSGRGEREGVGSSDQGAGGGGGPSEQSPAFGLARGGSMAPVTREEETAAPRGDGVGAFSEGKRASLGKEENRGSGSGSVRKRQRQHAAKAHESSPAPIFSTPQAFRLSSKQELANSPVEKKPGNRKSQAPLAERMRPVTVDGIVGQDSSRQMLRHLLDNETVYSMILYGPPGTGKTSLARAIALSLPGLHFVGLSAVHSGTKEVRVVLEEASKHMQRRRQRTLLFLDEVHRFNKSQQDLFLASVEAGTIIFIGATTENPSFEINAALLSRCRVLTLNKLEPEHVRKLLERAIADREKGVIASLPDSASDAGAGDCIIRVEEDALVFLAGAADGDARVALNAIEVAATAAYSEAKLSSNPNKVIGAVTSSRAGAQEKIGSAGNLTGSGKSLYGTERGGNGFGSKRLEALKENARDSSHANEDYSKPFKRFVGGKEITPLHNPTRFEREVVSLSPGDGGKDAVSFRGMEPTEPIEWKSSNPDAIVPDGADLDVSGGPGLVVRVTLTQAREAFQRSHILYDKTGEEHYNIISALHKSMRGADADAAIYWLARMLEGGEGPLYVARRLIRFASEDVGLADPHAMGVAVACYQACHFLGMPECNVNLAQCVVYLAYAPKSVVVYQAIEAAQKLVRETQQNEPVPFHLRNAPTRLMKDMGYGKGYIYPPGHAGRVEQEYMPPSLLGHKFLQWPEIRD